jgi:hypothetical protein
MLDADTDRPGQLLLANKLRLRRDRRLSVAPRCCAFRIAITNHAPAGPLLAPIQQLIELVYDTLKGQLYIELHCGRSLFGVTTRVAQRLLTLTAAVAPSRHSQPLLDQ